MAEKVTLAILLHEQRLGKPLYDPAPGTLYEVAPGCWVTLLPPTISRQERYFEAALRVGPTIDKRLDKKTLVFADAMDNIRDGLELGKIIAEGWEGVDEKELFGNMLLRLSMDFQTASKPMFQPSTSSSLPLSELVSNLAAATQDGQETGANRTGALT